TRPPPPSTLFPYTTLFRSDRQSRLSDGIQPPLGAVIPISSAARRRRLHPILRQREDQRRRHAHPHLVHEHRDLRRLYVRHGRPRSEEHTSELQSPCNLVCR